MTQIKFILPPKDSKPSWDLADYINDGASALDLENFVKVSVERDVFLEVMQSKFPDTNIWNIEKQNNTNPAEANLTNDLESMYSKLVKALSKSRILFDKQNPYMPFVDNILLEVKRLSSRLISDRNGLIFLYRYPIYSQPLTKTEKDSIVSSIPVQKSKGQQKRNEIMTLIVNHPSVYVEDLERKWNHISDNQIPLLNGLLQIPEMILKEHSENNYLNACIPVCYDPSAQENTLYLSFLDDTFADDSDKDDKILALQEFFGYTLFSHAKAKKALFLTGLTNTGKSVILKILQGLHGEDNVVAIGLERLNDPIALSKFFGKNLNLVPEIGSGTEIKDDVFKTLVSIGELISARVLYLGYVQFIATTKHVFCCNNLPIIKDKTNATCERILPIQFSNVVPSHKIDVNLADKILENKAGLLNWALSGAIRLHQNGYQFTLPESSKEILDRYRNGTQSGTFDHFLNTYCERDHQSVVLYQDLYSLLHQHQERLQGENCEISFIRSEKKFSRLLDDRGFKTARRPDPQDQRQKQRIIYGLKLRSNQDKTGRVVPMIRKQSSPKEESIRERD
jgi:P4 family phage/plasmid primase-like protien